MLPLICIDVDGTLVGPTGIPTDAVWAAADAAVGRGQHLALSTARGAMGSTYEWAQRLDPSGWHVFHAGGALVHTGTGETVEEALDEAVVDTAVEASRAHGWILEFYDARDYRVNDASPMAVDHASLMGVPHSFGSRDDISSIVRVQFVVPHAEVAGVTEVMRELAEVSTATSPVMTDATFVSITPHGVTKATAIAQIAATLGATMADVMMVGDGHNDLVAIAAVGHGVAMGNAQPEVAAAARHHVGNVTDDGLAEALELSRHL